MTKRINILLAVLFVFAVTSCGGPLKKNAMLIDAESAFARAKADPDVIKYAAEHLIEAEETLRKSAEARTDEEMSSLAYIGNNQVLTALEVKNFSLTENELARLREASSQFALRTRERETQQVMARKAQLEQQLAELQAEKTERGMVMTLGDVLFETGKAELMPGAVTMIRRLAQFMQQYQDKRVLIEGHTDSTGSASFNLRLSEDRANAVQSLLLSEGIPHNRTETIGYGMSRPVATNDTVEGRQRNRRVEIVIQ